MERQSAVSFQPVRKVEPATRNTGRHLGNVAERHAWFLGCPRSLAPSILSLSLSLSLSLLFLSTLDAFERAKCEVTANVLIKNLFTVSFPFRSCKYASSKYVSTMSSKPVSRERNEKKVYPGAWCVCVSIPISPSGRD